MKHLLFFIFAILLISSFASSASISDIFGEEVCLSLDCFYEEFVWKDVPRSILNPACGDFLLNDRWYCDVSGESLSHYVDDDTATYFFTGRLENKRNYAREIEYEWFICRCQEKEGSPPGICEAYYPEKNNSGGGSGHYREDCLGLGKITTTLGARERRLVYANVSQYKNELCGSFQIDLFLYDAANYTSCNRLMAAGIAFLCEDCVESFCGDGILDEGEECEPPNVGECNANCQLEECIDTDGDCVCDEEDDCPNSRPGELIDINGCDPFQFCRRGYCGTSCEGRDFIPRLLNCEEVQGEPEGDFPGDCTTAILHKEGIPYPGCFPTSCLN